jgi:hypothetical protein
MPRKPDPKKLLENIIDSHIKHLDYYKSIGKKNNWVFKTEYIEVGRYLTEYTQYKDYDKIVTYGIKMKNLLK